MTNKLELTAVMVRLVWFQNHLLDEETTIACWFYVLKTSGWTLEEFILQVILHELNNPIDYALLTCRV